MSDCDSINGNILDYVVFENRLVKNIKGRNRNMRNERKTFPILGIRNILGKVEKKPGRLKERKSQWLQANYQCNWMASKKSHL